MFEIMRVKVMMILKLLLIISIIFVNGNLYTSSFSKMKLSHNLGRWNAPCYIENCNNQPEVSCLATKARLSTIMMSHNGSHVIVCYLTGTNNLVDFGNFRGQWYFSEGNYILFVLHS